MKKSLKITLLLLLPVLCAVQLQAQKFGHLNAGNLIAQMPETAAADNKLKMFQDSMLAIGDARADSFQLEVQAFYTAYNEGTMTPAASQKRQAELEKKQQDLVNFEEEIKAAVNEQRGMLLEPIIKKIQDAINAVGKENSYTMIFDTSVFNTILFSKETDDIEPLVKAKLGLK